MYLNCEITNKISHHAHQVYNILTKTPRQTPHCDKNHTIPPSEYVNSCYKVYINKTVAGKTLELQNTFLTTYRVPMSVIKTFVRTYQNFLT